MRRRELFGLFLAGAAAPIVVAACGGPTTGPIETVTLSSTNRQPGTDPYFGDPVSVSLFQQRGDLSGLYNSRWEFWVEESPGVLIVGVWGGVWYATGAVVTVDEQASTVGVGIAIGTPPDAGNHEMSAELGGVRVVLSAPVGDRTVVGLNA